MLNNWLFFVLYIGENGFKFDKLVYFVWVLEFDNDTKAKVKSKILKDFYFLWEEKSFIVEVFLLTSISFLCFCWFYLVDNSVKRDFLEFSALLRSAVNIL